MLQKLINRKTTFIFILFSFILFRCANQLPPGGGEVDLIPPEIIEVYPEPGTIMFDDDYFEIDFSEYVDKRSVKEAIFISPYIEEGLDYEWTGTSLTATFKKGLEEDKTYTITIGTDVVDHNNRNRMAQSYSFSFSTGEKIDTKSISGKVYDKEPEGILIFAYKLDDGADTLLNRKPDYVSQSGSDGSFSLNGLSSAVYRVFAVRDKFRDLIFQSDQDEIGAPFKDVSLEDPDSTFEKLTFKLFNADTTKPRFISAIMTDDRHILGSFSVAIDKDLVTADNFYLYDSTEATKTTFLFAYKGNTKDEEIVLVPGETLPVDNDIYLFADTIKDTKGNITLNDYTKITLTNKPDTNSIKIYSTQPRMNQQIDFINPQIRFLFNDAFVKHNIKSKITFTDTLGKNIDYDVEFEDDAFLNIKPAAELKTETDYIVTIDLSELTDASGNKGDSTYTLKFRTITGLDFTGASGTLLNIELSNNPVLVLQNAENKELVYKKIITSTEFEFTRIEPGNYQLWCFLDKDSSGNFNYGWAQPFETSEKFFVYPDTLNLKPRWVVTEVTLTLD